MTNLIIFEVSIRSIRHRTRAVAKKVDSLVVAGYKGEMENTLPFMVT